MLDDGDKAQCMEIAREIVEKVMAAHIASCPHGQLMRRSKAWLLGCSVGVGLGSGTIAVALTKIFGGIGGIGG